MDPAHPNRLHPPPALALLPGQDRERADGLPTSDAFALAPFYYATPDTRLPALQPAPLAEPQLPGRLRRLRNSRAAKLLAGSSLLLRALQLEMDLPAAWRSVVRRQSGQQLRQLTGRAIDPQALYLELAAAYPWVDEQGQEHHSLQLTWLELLCRVADPQQRPTLLQACPADLIPPPGWPPLMPGALLRQALEQDWPGQYRTDLDAFWQHHGSTWRLLARLSLLDELDRQHHRGALGREGYQLCLDALGYRSFPGSPAELARQRPRQAAQLWLLYLGEQAVPGLLQVRSLNNDHCFVLRPGSGLPTIEYISDDPAHMTRRLLEACNASTAHRAWLHEQQDNGAAMQAQARSSAEDIAQALQQAAHSAGAAFWQKDASAWLLQPIRRALTLASAVDLWQPQPPLLQQLPEPRRLAEQLMRGWLNDVGRLALNPNQVFVAWRPGGQFVPQGHVRQAASDIQVPDTRPRNLVQALIDRFQTTQPRGYRDEGGHWALWHDPTGRGRWQADKRLPLDAEALAQHIAATDLLALMTQEIESFWTDHHPHIEQHLRSTLVHQAVIGLKLGQLSRSGFDWLAEQLDNPDAQWQVLGFQVQSSLLDGLQAQPCASLLLLRASQGERVVLYQAGLCKAFIEFESSDALNRYLMQAMADPPWREAVLRYVPERHQVRLGYLFRFWGKVQVQEQPASLLRPWSDLLYHRDHHQDAGHALFEQGLARGQPFAFVCRTLKANALEHARQTIVTPAQQRLRAWTGWLRHLQWLLAPMSLLLTPATLAALAIDVGMTALDVATAQLPGPRQREKQQAMLSLLTLGLWRIGPATPRLLGALHKTVVSGRRLPPRLTRRGGGAWPSHTPDPRQTHLAPFFQSGALLKRWSLAAHPHFGGLPVHAWKLGRRFLLWTSERGQARTLVVSTHGYYLPWSRTVKIPNGTEIRTFAPHQHVLIDPGLHRVVSQRTSPYALSTTAGNRPVAELPPRVMTDRMMAGTSRAGHLKNYTLSKYQGSDTETYADISQIVRNSHAPPFPGQPGAVPMDILTVRNRFGTPPPSLETLFDTLAGLGIHYDRIFLVHCRCAAINALLGRAPLYQPSLHVNPVPATP